MGRKTMRPEAMGDAKVKGVKTTSSLYIPVPA